MDKSELVCIANYLTTETKGKKHGGYNIYQDDKIIISYDTYYPNVQVNVFINGESELAAIYSGHGHVQEFHGGAWCEYVSGILYPKAVIAKAESKDQSRKRAEEKSRRESKPLNDAGVFA